MRIKLFIIAFLLTFSSTFVTAQLSEKERFEISKNLDIYNALLKELILNYVDTLDAKKIIQTNIASMLKRLDPYTEYIPEEDMSDFQFQTTGEYGGVGAIISLKENKIIIVDPYEGMPAALAGLRPGDIILEIDGEKMEERSTTYASDKLKGQPHTPVKIKIQRPGEKNPRIITVERKRIHIDPVTYYSVLKDSIGYISLSAFTAQSAQSVKAALTDLIANHRITSLIFEVRDNGGGVVDDCLDMLNFFLPKGELLLSMRGKAKHLDRIYRSTQSPIAPDLPLVILVNQNSASASEILSGTLQDLDRGMIIGTRTFGKGLVQSTVPLPYEGRLKLTTSKYYIPSGRSIQAIDYAHRNDDESVSSIPDSLTNVFYTSNGRPVKDGGGILPDFVVEEEKIPTIIYYMEAKYIFFDFAVQWQAAHPQIASPSEFILTEDMYDAFKVFVKSKDFTYDRQSEKAMESLKTIMDFEGYMDAASEEFLALENKLKPDLNRDLNLHKKAISKYLSMQLMKHYYYAKGQLIYELREDAVLDKAIEILSDTSFRHLFHQPFGSGSSSANTH
jgi:carboxyl-terminal processing protease